jgi:hypothetical protein
VKGVESNGLRVVLAARKEEAQHVVNLDLFGAPSRKGCSSAAAKRLSVEAPKVEDDLLALLEALESLQGGARNGPTTVFYRASGALRSCTNTKARRARRKARALS